MQNEYPFSSFSPPTKGNSLKDIADRLISYLNSIPNKTFDLNGIASILGITKRRLYDILNIAHPLGLVSRHGSGTYQWQSINPPIDYFRGESFASNGPNQRDIINDSHVRCISAHFLNYVKNSKSDIVTIDDLIKHLLDGKKSGLRRIYDVIAIYEALNLISRKPRSGQITILPAFRSIFRTNLIPLKKRNYIPFNPHIAVPTPTANVI